MIDNDANFCPVCGKKVKPLPSDDSFNNISPENSIDIPVNEIPAPYVTENNSQPEFSPEKQEKVTPESPEDDKPFFGSTEPISHINPEPLTENTEKVPEKHTRESLPELVLRKKTVPPSEVFPEENYNPEEFPKSPEPYNDNSDTQYIPYDEIQENLNNNYNPPPEYDNVPPYVPEYPENQPYFDPPPPPAPPFREQRPAKVGGFRLFGAGIVTVITTFLVIVLSLLFCVKIGFSGTVLEKSINNLDTEKILEAEYDGNHDVNEFLYEKTGFYNITFGMANENDFRNFVLNLDMTGFIGKNVAVYADYLLNTGKKPSLTSEDIAEYMFNKSGYNNLNRQDFSTMIYNVTDGHADDLLSVDGWQRQTGFDFRISGYVFSYVTLIIILALVFVLIIWTYAIVNMRMRYITGFTKAVFMTSGVIMLIVGAVGVIAPPIVYSQTSHVVFYIGSKLLKDFNLFMLVTGGFEFIAGIILGLIKKLIVRHERKYGDG